MAIIILKIPLTPNASGQTRTRPLGSIDCERSSETLRVVRRADGLSVSDTYRIGSDEIFNCFERNF